MSKLDCLLAHSAVVCGGWTAACFLPCPQTLHGRGSQTEGRNRSLRAHAAPAWLRGGDGRKSVDPAGQTANSGHTHVREQGSHATGGYGRGGPRSTPTRRAPGGDQRNWHASSDL